MQVAVALPARILLILNPPGSAELPNPERVEVTEFGIIPD